MSASAPAFPGVVLCRVGEVGLAVRAQDVDAIAPDEAEAVDARLAFGLAARSSEGRAVQCRGRLLKVDSVDVVSTEGVRAFAVPHALVHAANGALVAFVEVRGVLWPVVDVAVLVEHLASGEASR